MRQLFIFIFCLSGFVYGQNTLQGIVTNSVSSEPVDHASVYISGTSKGTYTDSRGHFKLDGIVTPCLLVISHLNYDLKTIWIKNPELNQISVNVKEKQLQLSEVTVKGKSFRAQNVEMFKKAFLGADWWGSNAVLLNDSDLIFSRQVDTIVGSSDAKMKRFIITLSVTAKAPLKIELPLLGYHLSVDLVNFTVKEDGLLSNNNLLGYFFYQPYLTDNKLKQSKYERNRLSVYYNSSLHFNRALYNNNLASNGYLLVGESMCDSLKKRVFSAVNLQVDRNKSNSTEAFVRGQNNKNYLILYFEDNKKPLNLASKGPNQEIDKYLLKTNYSKQSKETMSTVMFKSDTCIVRVDGTLPDNKIVFGGKMSSKMVGAMLPDDYQPGENNKIFKESH